MSVNLKLTYLIRIKTGALSFKLEFEFGVNEFSLSCSLFLSLLIEVFGSFVLISVLLYIWNIQY
jgi:hypothetical protein